MEIVSGLTSKPHVTSQQFRQIIEGTVGQGSYIITSGESLKPELAANNLLKIRSGMMSHHGNISSVKLGTYDEVSLTNGSQGMKRIDLVVNRYTKSAETNIESNEWVVIQGTPAVSNPAVPAYTIGNLQNGDLVDDCPVFEVHFDGINVTEVKKLLSVAPNINEVHSKLSAALDYDPTQKTYYEDGWRLIYRYISKNQVYVLVEKTNQGETAAQMHAKILSSCPLKALFKQEIPVKMAVANTVVGYGGMEFNGNTVYLSSTAYNNPVTWHGYGIITVE
nr:MAG TPA: hypothetical protein [Caudoviricetes sp.]